MLRRIESILQSEPYYAIALGVFMIFFGAFLWARTESKFGPVLLFLGAALCVLTFEAVGLTNMF